MKTQICMQVRINTELEKYIDKKHKQFKINQ